MSNNETILIIFVIVPILIVAFFYGYIKFIQKMLQIGLDKLTKERLHSWKDKKLINVYKGYSKSSLIVLSMFMGGIVGYFVFRKFYAKMTLLIQQELIERNLPHGLNGWESLNKKLEITK